MTFLRKIVESQSRTFLRFIHITKVPPFLHFKSYIQPPVSHQYVQLSAHWIQSFYSHPTYLFKFSDFQSPPKHIYSIYAFKKNSVQILFFYYSKVHAVWAPCFNIICTFFFTSMEDYPMIFSNTTCIKMQNTLSFEQKMCNNFSIFFPLGG
jgi:hypothetical protein